MSPTSETELRQVNRVSATGTPASRNNLVRILFVHRSIADVERCLHELRRVRFNVSSDVVVTPEQFVDRLRLRLFDLIVAEHPSTNWQETRGAGPPGSDEAGHPTHLFSPWSETRDRR